MNRLILDYYRRWAWVLAAVGLLEFWLGWRMASRPGDPFEFWAFLLALWCSATLLSFDFRRGALRPIAVLPLKARQIGRGWWLATVPFPAVALAALLFLGAGTCCHFHPDKVFPARHLAIASLFAAVWLGIGFTMIFNSTRGLGERGLGKLFGFLTSILCMVLFFGSMLLNQGAAGSPWRITVLLGVGSVLTVVGWWLAEQFDPARAWLYLGRPGQPDLGRVARPSPGPQPHELTPLELKTAATHYRAPGGHGGMPLLIRDSVARSFVMAAALVGLMVLIALGQQQALPNKLALRVVVQTGSYMACGFILIFQLLPVLRQLRLLRTLPIPATRLAAVMIALVVLPLAAVGLVGSAVAWPLLGPPVATVFLKSYTFLLAPAALCAFFAFWRGEGVLGYVLMIGTLFGFLHLHNWLQLALRAPGLPSGLLGTFALAGVVLSFFLTRQAVGRSSKPYRVRVSIAGSFPWGAGR